MSQSQAWIANVKSRTLTTVAPTLGLRPMRMNSYGPCPACSESQRGSDDRRGAIGAAKDKRGWRCHRCNVKGDAVDLIAWVKYGKGSSDLTGGEWHEIRDWCSDEGWCDSAAAGGEGRAKTRSAGSLVQGLMGQDRRRDRSPSVPSDSPPKERSGNGGPFAWREGLAEECAIRLLGASRSVATELPERLNPEPDACADAVMQYLQEGRMFTLDTIKEWGLGCIQVKGEPWLTIPLRDHSERVVNVRFRSVPPAKKAYRVCPGRPLPLFGADRLGMDLGSPVLVTEGELDVIAMWQYGYQVSVVSGTAGASTWKDEWLDALEAYEGFTLLSDNDDAGNAHAKAFAEKIGLDRCSRAILPRKDAGQCLIDEIPVESVGRCIELSQPMFGIKLKRVDAYEGDLQRLIDNPEELVGRPTASKAINRSLGGWRPGLIILGGDTGQGKAQPVDEPVLTPSGKWVPIGSLSPGDKVVAVDGKPTKVSGVFPQGVREIREVEFSDGTRVRCDREHLWSVRTDTHVRRGQAGKVITIDEIASSLRGDGGRYRWRVPLADPTDRPDTDLPLDPYVLGVLLGDGSTTRRAVVFTSADSEVIDGVRARLPAGHRMSVSDTPSKARRCNIAAGTADRNQVTHALRGLGVWGKRARDKFVPETYLMGSVNQRLELLQGLMDTDGYASTKGWCIFTTSSEKLAQGVRDLAHSLGGSTRTNTKIPTYRYGGKKHQGLLAHNVIVVLPNGLHQRMFTIERKRDRIKRVWKPMRKIVAVHDAGKAECVCIAVDHPKHLYVTRGWIVTHNTTAGTWACWEDCRRGTPTMITSFENRPVAAIQKLLRMQLGGDFLRVTPDERREALRELGHMPLHVVDHYGQIEPKVLMESIRYGARRLGVKMVLVDHLGFLVSPDADDERRTIEAVIRALALTAYTYGVTIFLVCHPKTLERGQTVPTMNDFKGASAIKQDASEVIIIERDPPRPNAKPPRDWPAAIWHFTKVRSEFGIPGSKATLAFGPLSCRYADAWELLPDASGGQLLIVPPT